MLTPEERVRLVKISSQIVIDSIRRGARNATIARAIRVNNEIILDDLCPSVESREGEKEIKMTMNEIIKEWNKAKDDLSSASKNKTDIDAYDKEYYENYRPTMLRLMRAATDLEREEQEKST